MYFNIINHLERSDPAADRSFHGFRAYKVLRRLRRESVRAWFMEEFTVKQRLFDWKSLSLIALSLLCFSGALLV